jgi:hypothetical protein
MASNSDFRLTTAASDPKSYDASAQGYNELQAKSRTQSREGSPQQQDQIISHSPQDGEPYIEPTASEAELNPTSAEEQRPLTNSRQTTPIIQAEIDSHDPLSGQPHGESARNDQPILHIGFAEHPSVQADSRQATPTPQAQIGTHDLPDEHPHVGSTSQTHPAPGNAVHQSSVVDVSSSSGSHSRGVSRMSSQAIPDSSGISKRIKTSDDHSPGESWFYFLTVEEDNIAQLRAIRNKNFWSIEENYKGAFFDHNLFNVDVFVKQWKLVDDFNGTLLVFKPEDTSTDETKNEIWIDVVKKFLDRGEELTREKDLAIIKALEQEAREQHVERNIESLWRQ